jgi:LysM repeat protein
MINTRVPLYMIVFLLLSGCGPRATPTLTPVPIVPTSTSPEEATSTVSVVTPTMETPTVAVTEQTETLEPTATPQPTATTTSAMQITIVSDAEQTSGPQPGPCQRPQNWIAYTVQLSDTLSSLAQRTGTSWQQIQAANCLTGNLIFAGQTLYLPFTPAAATNLPNPLPTILTMPPHGPGDAKLSVSPTFGLPGTTFIIGMDDFPPNQGITLEITFAYSGESIIKVTLTPNSDGDTALSYISPQNAKPGKYNVYADSIFGDSVIAKTGEFLITIPQTQTP